MSIAALTHPVRARLRAPVVLWGVAVGLVTAATPLVFWWLDAATVYAFGLVVIASVYIGFAVADRRRTVLAVECTHTRWWPPFCVVVDWTTAMIVAVGILAGAQFHH